jgi:hypothetical protein
MFREPKWTLPGIGSLRSGEAAAVLETAIHRHAVSWVRILASDGIGWCNSDAVEVISEAR